MQDKFYKFDKHSAFAITKENIFLISGSILSTAFSVAISLMLGLLISHISQGMDASNQITILVLILSSGFSLRSHTSIRLCISFALCLKAR